MRTLVLGGGVIGTTTAYYLAREHGHEVEVVERRPGVALETSFANGGVLHTSEVEPWSRPGTVRLALRSLGQGDAPLLVRYGALPRMWRWGLAFARECAPERFHRNTRINLRLARHALEAIREIRAETGIAYDQRETGSMRIYADPASFAAARAHCERVAPDGLSFEALDAGRAVGLEPALGAIDGPLAGALYFPPDEAGDCHKFTAGLKRHCERALGVRFHFETPVTALEREGDRIAAVRTEGGERLSADSVVVALGSFTAPMLRPLGVRLPIYPVKGVSVTVPAAAWEGPRPRVPMIHDARMFGLVPLGDRLRVPGSVEIDGYDAAPDPRRCRALVDSAIGVFPALAKCYDPATALHWAGLRPMTPSGTPILGATPVRNLFVNAGHGHLGWTMSCGAARVVAGIVAGKEPGIDLTGLTLAAG